MKKLTLASFIVLIHDVALAQHFFQSYEIMPYLYSDNVYYGVRNWKYVFEAPGKPQSPRLDSMRSQSKHADRALNFDIQYRLQKKLLAFGKYSNGSLEWHIGPGYRSFKNSGASYSTWDFLGDTTKVDLFESENFELTYHYLDIYNALVVRNANGHVHLFIGFGLQASIPLGRAHINEDYSARAYQWNTTTRRWEEISRTNGHFSSKAKKTYVFSFSVPAGFTFDVADNCELKFGLEYFNARRSPRIGKNYSEGIMVQIGLRYDFP